ncbi:hypothetical protein GCM10010149_34480 [Nonomuraea roseoviolacea subsp. roseoviolacea]|uniref:Esterase-like activity of phytase family protein n=1 Tax=Nonomuraea roseoviolacea subsp. carminata TaxID=160689 RepID=A0ABT1K4S6_9ACTN|nr:hypothetical protein [Nonomuraea roseoviolacea]MCP2348034.1 hypothetical protein [Nonomuraea roseoviolacea subsp. carminata]
MGDLRRAAMTAAVTCAVLGGLAAPAAAGATGRPRSAADDVGERLFRFKDKRITESSGLALSPTHDGIFYTHNDSSAAPVFYAVDGDGRTRATFHVSGAQARDWEAMAATKDPATGRGVLWFADIGDNLDGAWPDVSVYKVTEPETLRDATLPAVRYRFRYADGARNAEGLMVNPVTGRLYVVSKEFAGSVYAAPAKLRTGRVNVLRKVAAAPLMATDAAYAPDGSSYVIRTYFSATVYRPNGDMIAKMSMPELDQAESITYTADGRSVLVGSEGVSSPVYRVPLPAEALRGVKASARPSATPSARASQRAARTASPRPQASDGGAERGLTVRDVLIWLAAAAGATGVITYIARRTR